MSAVKNTSLFGMFKSILGLTIIKNVLTFLPNVGAVVFVLYLIYIAWFSIGPRKPAPDFARIKTADIAVANIIDEIRLNRGGVTDAVMIHFANDPSDCFSNKLRDAIESSGVLDINDVSFGEKLRTKLNLRIPGVSSSKEALSEGRAAGVSGVLWGALERFESFSGGVVIKGSWQLLETASGRPAYNGKIDIDTTKTASAILVKTIHDAGKEIGKSTEGVNVLASAYPWRLRFLFFVAALLILPVVTIAFLRAMVAKRSNGVNAFVLGIYTALDAVFAFIMVGGAFDSFFAVAVFMIACGLALAYNTCIMRFALKLEAQ